MIPKSKKFKKSDYSRSTFFSIFLIILVLAIISFLVISNLKINKKRVEILSQISSLKKEIQILEEKKQKLQSGISESQSESFLEKEARERLNLKKPGEEVVVVLPAEESEEEAKEEKNFWQKILEKLGF